MEKYGLRQKVRPHPKSVILIIIIIIIVVVVVVGMDLP